MAAPAALVATTDRGDKGSRLNRCVEKNVNYLTKEVKVMSPISKAMIIRSGAMLLAFSLGSP